MEEQEKVEQFVEEHGLEGTTAFKILDLLAEAGEIAGDAAKSSDYGSSEEELEVKQEEIGDALFSLLNLASELDIDAGDALEASMEKYRQRIDQKGDPGSR